ncbi:MAG: TolC family protein [Candidatus Rokuibacteriota bacterium]
MSGRRVLMLTVMCSSLVLEPWRAAAQDQPALGVYTIDALVTKALRDNPEVAAARAEVDAGRGRVTQAGLRPNPTLELGGQKALSPDNNVTVGLSLPLDLNGRKAGRVGVAERDLEMKQAQLADRERRLSAEVRMKAADLLAARRDLQVNDELLSANREALGLVGEQVRRGAIPALEENLLLVEVNRLDASRRLLEGRAEIYSLQLRALAALPDEAPFSLAGQLEPAVSVPDRGAAVVSALEQRADLRAARAEGAMARAKVLREQAEGRWDASVSVGYQRQEMGFGLNGLTDRGGVRPIQDTFHFFGGGVSVMLPVRNQNQGNVAAARAEAVAADRRVELASLVIRQEVASAFTQYDAARRSLEIYARGVRDVARQNLDVVRRTYQLGRTTLLDVISEQRRYIEIEMGYTEALKQVYGAAVEIERALGGPAR